MTPSNLNNILITFSALYGSFFGVEADAAFSYYRLAESIGFIIAFAYSGLLCTSVKIYIMIGVLIISMICYFIAEKVEKGRVSPAVDLPHSD